MRDTFVFLNIHPILDANKFERGLWVILTVMGFALASVMLKDAVVEWIQFPTRKIVIITLGYQKHRVIFFSEVTIETFAYPATELEYPAITVCKKGSYNVDEYVRAVFDNFATECSDDKTCADTAPFRDDFPSYLKVIISAFRIIPMYMNTTIGKITIFYLLG